MATLESGIGLLQNFGFYSVILPLILITALIYGLLTKIEIFGENKTVNLTVAFVIAFIFISFSNAVEYISILIPYFVIILVIVLLLIMLFMFMGADTDQVMEAVKHPAGYGTILVVFILIIFVLMNMLGPEIPVDGGTGDGSGEGERSLFDRLFFSPPIMGLILLVAIFGTATYMITRTEE